VSRCLRVLFFLAALSFATAPLAARAALILHVSSDRLVFYNNLYVMTGYGAVRLDLRNGSKISGDALVFDLRLNRFVVSGNVRVTTPQATYAGTALSTDLASGTSYLIALDGPAPQRLIFRDERFASPESGGEMALEAFAFPELKKSPASLISRNVTVGVGSYIRFDGCRSQILGGFSYYFPLPICYISFGNDPNLAQDALSGANVGAQYKFAGNANATSSFLLNYDTVNKLYAALEQNVSSPNAWAVAAVNTQNGSQSLSAIGYVQPAQELGLRVASQLHVLSTNTTNDVSQYSYSNAQLTQGLPGANLQLNYSYGNVVSQGPGPNLAIGTYDPMQPSSFQLGLRTSDLKLGPFFLNGAGGYGETHDPFGLQTFGGVNYTAEWFDLYELDHDLGHTDQVVRRQSHAEPRLRDRERGRFLSWRAAHRLSVVRSAARAGLCGVRGIRNVPNSFRRIDLYAEWRPFARSDLLEAYRLPGADSEFLRARAGAHARREPLSELSRATTLRSLHRVAHQAEFAAVA
jgi:hypothetical protein